MSFSCFFSFLFVSLFIVLSLLVLPVCFPKREKGGEVGKTREEMREGGTKIRMYSMKITSFLVTIKLIKIN